MHFMAELRYLELCTNDADLYPMAQFISKVTALSNAAYSHLLYVNVTEMLSDGIKLWPNYTLE
jgi:hypothetical protein